MRKSNRRKTALAVLAGAMIVGTGVAAHAALPGAASTVASGKLASLGVTVPGPNSHAGTHPDSRGNSGATGQADPQSSHGKGSEISTLATTTTATGVAKGALISSTASGGHSQAGTHGGASSGTANTGGTGTADAKSGGHSTTGTTKANTASGGRSANGSGNAGGHRP
jgi:hypothetical protein